MSLTAIFFLALGFASLTILILRHIKDQKLLKTVTMPYRGTSSERKMVLSLLKAKVPAQTIFHDLYLRNSDGRYSQLDLVVATSVGIIVFEIKDYSGWIFGTGSQRDWTQVLAYGKRKYQFYNPIFQNRKHISDLIRQLSQFKKVPFYSVIVFFGRCEFRDLRLIPDDVFLIRSKDVPEVLEKILLGNSKANYTDKWEVVRLLSTAVQNGDKRSICEEHIKNIKAMRYQDN
jgi:hypothetical protein